METINVFASFDEGLCSEQIVAPSKFDSPPPLLVPSNSESCCTTTKDFYASIQGDLIDPVKPIWCKI